MLGLESSGPVLMGRPSSRGRDLLTSQWYCRLPIHVDSEGQHYGSVTDVKESEQVGARGRDPQELPEVGGMRGVEGADLEGRSGCRGSGASCEVRFSLLHAPGGLLFPQLPARAACDGAARAGPAAAGLLLLT